MTDVDDQFSTTLEDDLQVIEFHKLGQFPNLRKLPKYPRVSWPERLFNEDYIEAEMQDMFVGEFPEMRTRTRTWSYTDGETNHTLDGFFIQRRPLGEFPDMAFITGPVKNDLLDWAC